MILLPQVDTELGDAAADTPSSYDDDFYLNGDFSDGLRHQRGKADFKLVMCLYCSHFLSCFADRLWQFAIPVMLMKLWSDSLLPSALFQFVLCLAMLICMPHLGNYIDKNNRLKTIFVSFFGQFFFTMVTTLFLYLVFYFSEVNKQNNQVEWTAQIILLFCMLLFAATCSELMAAISNIALERDWLIVLAGGGGYDDDMETTTMSSNLSHLNVVIRRIDLFCKFVAPLVFGLILQFGSQAIEDQVYAGVTVLVVYHFLTVLPMYYMCRALYNRFAPLSRLKAASLSSGVNDKMSIVYQLRSYWSNFIHHPVFLASLSYCMLYMTVLDNGTLMVSYLTWVNIPPGALGATRGLGAMMGLLGTVLYIPLKEYFNSILKAGNVSIWAFVACILPALVVFTVPFERAVVQAYVVMACVVVSRVALWVYDLAHTEIMQLHVKDNARCAINACQTALYQLFWLIISFFGIIFSRPEEYAKLIFISVASVFSAALLFSVWSKRFHAVTCNYEGSSLILTEQ